MCVADASVGVITAWKEKCIRPTGREGRNVTVKECTGERTKMYPEKDTERIVLSEKEQEKNKRRKMARC